MKDSQPRPLQSSPFSKYIKANNERFSTIMPPLVSESISISRRIMKDSQPSLVSVTTHSKYIKANNERFSTTCTVPARSA